MVVFIGGNRSNARSILLPLECYFLTVNCVARQRQIRVISDRLTVNNMRICNR
jgi:hypothetical protein